MQLKVEEAPKIEEYVPATQLAQTMEDVADWNDDQVPKLHMQHKAEVELP